jgi:uncharacterized protein YdaU (DUF1376 family)
VSGWEIAINYYPHHLGDYEQRTGHLTMLQDGAYRRLLDAYYKIEKPLPLDRAELYRMTRAMTKPERAAIEQTLHDFFEKTPDGWRHVRCDEEIARYQAKAEKNRENGRHSKGRPGAFVPRGTKPSGLPDGNPVGIQDVTQVGGMSEPKRGAYPITNNQEKEEKKPPDGGPASQDDTIWTLGVSLLTKAGSTEGTARSFLGKHAKGGKGPKLAQVLARMSLRPVADPRSYIEAAMRESGDGVGTYSAAELAP